MYQIYFYDASDKLIRVSRCIYPDYETALSFATLFKDHLKGMNKKSASYFHHLRVVSLCLVQSKREILL